MSVSAFASQLCWPASVCYHREKREVVLPVRPAGRSREPEYLVPYQPRCLAALPCGKGKASGVSPEEKKLRQFSYPIVSACLAIGNVGSWGVSEDGVCAAHPHLRLLHLQSTLW